MIDEFGVKAFLNAHPAALPHEIERFISGKIAELESMIFSLRRNAIKDVPTESYINFVYRRQYDQIEIVGVKTWLDSNTFKGVYITTEKRGWDIKGELKSEGYRLWLLANSFEEAVKEACEGRGNKPHM